MGNFDHFILNLINTLFNSHSLLVTITLIVYGNHLFKGIFIVTLLWWVWMKDTDKLITKELFPIRTIFGAFLGVVTARLAQNYLPMRLRPIHNSDINFVAPYEMSKNVLEGWSSFPSDHAVLFFALSTAIWSRNRTVGVFVFAWSLIVICFPRIYLGFHYPTDIIAGALLGIGIMFVFLRIPLPSALWTLLGWMQNRHIGWLYAGIFFFSLQMATLFDSVRKLAGNVKTLLVLIWASI